jgi:hypothetical protein
VGLKADVQITILFLLLLHERIENNVHAPNIMAATGLIILGVLFIILLLSRAVLTTVTNAHGLDRNPIKNYGFVFPSVTLIIRLEYVLPFRLF